MFIPDHHDKSTQIQKLHFHDILNFTKKLFIIRVLSLQTGLLKIKYLPLKYPLGFYMHDGLFGMFDKLIWIFLYISTPDAGKNNTTNLIKIFLAF